MDKINLPPISHTGVMPVTLLPIALRPTTPVPAMMGARKPPRLWAMFHMPQ